MNDSSEPAADPIVRRVLTLIVIATTVRIVAGAMVELGNDEVYYWTYAAFPDWSHFDHPPMVGWLIQLFTLNLVLSHEAFIRLGAAACAAASTWLMYRVAARLAGPLAGLIAALLHTSSIYGSVLAGIVILPDAPLVFFWLLTLALLLESLPAEEITDWHRRRVVAAGVTIGLAMLSKYHGVFLAFGAGSYILLFDRRWLREAATYGAAIIAAVLAMPIVIWNVRNDFISFTYHSGRATPSLELRLDLFFTELGGQVAYQNPVTWILMLVAVIAIARGRGTLRPGPSRLLLLMFLPLWTVFTGISLFRGTLPHWTGPAYLSLMVLTAVQGAQVGHLQRRFLAPLVVLAPLLLAAVLTIGFAPAGFGRDDPETARGERDGTMDMFGWSQIRSGVEEVLETDVTTGRMTADAAIFSYRWFPAAHLDYYLATPLGRRLFVAGSLERVHKYYWINQEREPLREGDDAYYVAVSNWFEEPDMSFARLFASIEAPDTVRVFRSGAHVKNAFIYRLRGYNGGALVPDVD